MSRGGTNRREFFLGKNARDEFIESVSVEKFERDRLPVGSVEAKQANYLEQYSKNAMACEFEICFNLRQHPISSSAAMMAFILLDELEAQMTVYRDDSEISRLNKTAFKKPVVVEAQLFQLLLLGRTLYAETHGAFDFTAGNLTKVWGFQERRGRLPKPETIEAALQLVGSDHLDFDDLQETVCILKEGVMINLGGIGKGYALDRIGQLIQSTGVGDFIIHGGQSSLLARGSSLTGASLSPHSTEEATSRTIGGWQIGVTHPNLPHARLAHVTLRDQAIGTSGTARQGFFHKGKRYGHIIDPRTGWPAGHFLSTTAIAPTAAEADALATAFFVMTEEEVVNYCRNHPAIGAILISGVDKRSSQVQITTLNIADEDWELASDR